MNLATFLNASARSYGDRPAVVVGSHIYLDYAALARASAGLGAVMRQQFGLRQGDRVLLAMVNNPDYLTILFACWQAGLTAVPVNAALHGREIAHIAADSGARLVFATPDQAQRLAAEKPDLPLVLPQSAEFQRLAAADPCAPATGSPADIAWIFYTSGTTGRPKGAMLSHRNLQAMTLAYLADVDHLTPRDSLLHLAATSHASGLFSLSFIAKAGANILPESGGYEPQEMAQIIAAQPSLTYFAPSTLLNRMAADPVFLAAPLENIRTILTGAGPIYLENLRTWLAAFGPKIWNGYGQGETPCTITAMPKEVLWQAYLDDDVERMTSVGIARTGLEVRIAAADATSLLAGETGEVLVRGETVMAGYLNRPDDSAAALRDGWLHTGDMGRMDERGFLTLLDRMKDVIITGGMNVYAREVEEVLLSHPDIAECAVIGIKDHEWGEIVVAVVVARAGATPPDTAQFDSLCLERLARFKRPKKYIIVDALPKNAAGKVMKTELRQSQSVTRPAG